MLALNAAPNPLRRDPTRTVMLRRQFSADLSRRYIRLKGKVTSLIVDEDAFGLRQRTLVIHEEQDDEDKGESRRDADGNPSAMVGLLPGSLDKRLVCGDASNQRNLGGSDSDESLSWLVLHQRFAFRTDTGKVTAFQAWLAAQTNEMLADEVYWQRYVERGYQQGMARAFDDTRAAKRAELGGGAEQLGFYEGSREEFLQSAFARPQSIEKVKLLASRTFSDLKGVSTVMATEMTRVLPTALCRVRVRGR